MPKGIFLGFDFGMSKIGVAIGQNFTKSANPLCIIKAKQGVPDWLEIDKLVADWKVEGLIVGIPFQLEGGEQQISLAARKFARKLYNRYQLPVHLIDERLTTKMAKSELSEQWPITRATFETVDDYAAKLILEAWLRTQKEEN